MIVIYVISTLVCFVSFLSLECKVLNIVILSPEINLIIYRISGSIHLNFPKIFSITNKILSIKSLCPHTPPLAYPLFQLIFHFYPFIQTKISDLLINLAHFEIETILVAQNCEEIFFFLAGGVDFAFLREKFEKERV